MLFTALEPETKWNPSPRGLISIANWSSKVGEESVAKFMAKAFGEWSKYSKLRFVRVYDPSADIIVGFGSGHHGDK